jgi:Lysozyme like domain
VSRLKTLALVAILFALMCFRFPGEADARARVLPIGHRYPHQVERWRDLLLRRDKHGHHLYPLWASKRHQQEALAVIWDESGGDPRQRYHTRREDSRGLFQRNCRSWHSAQAKRRLYEPAYNVASAYKCYVARGWSPWSVARRMGLR